MGKKASKKRVSKKPLRIVWLDFSEANFEAWADFQRGKESVTQYLPGE
jgi:hypothetical protein